MKILSYEYKVVQEPGFRQDRNNNNNARWQGMIDYEKQEIRIDPEHPEHMQTLIHEIIHGVARYFVVEMDEADTERIAQGVYNVMTENGVDLKPLLK